MDQRKELIIDFHLNFRPMNPDVLIALGINPGNVFEPRPKTKVEDIQVKLEPNTLLEDYAKDFATNSADQGFYIY